MGKYLGEVRVATTESVESLKGLFDADFTENEEYYREDTLELGYEDEAERVIKENTNEDGSYNISALISLAFNDSHYLDYNYHITHVKSLEGKDIQIISIAYMEQ